MAKKKKQKKIMKDDDDFYCLCCKEKVKADPKSICIDIYKNGRYALRGICPIKNCSMSTFISDEYAEEIKRTKKYNCCGEVDSGDGNKIAEAGSILAFLALLGGAIAYAVKSSKC